MIIEDDVKLDYSDVLIRPKRSTLTSRFEVDMNKTYRFYHSKKEWTGVPIMASNMDTTGTFDMHKVLSQDGMITCIARHNNTKGMLWKEAPDKNKLCVMSGISESEIIEINAVANTYPEIAFVGLDVANGYTKNFVDAAKRLREYLPDSTIIAGNVATADMVAELILAGVDIVKVGVGPGSVCTTRIKTGIGYPQLSSVIECADAAHGIGGHIIADGGCNSSGDIVKAFAAGADFVMLGGMLAGTDQCEGDWEYDNGNKKALKFYGMSSHAAQKKYGGVKNYRASEGRIKKVTYKGDASLIVEDILGGLRSACSYIGSTSLKHMSRCAEFNLVNRTHFDQSV